MNFFRRYRTRTTTYNRLAHIAPHVDALRHKTEAYHSVYCGENTTNSGSRNVGWRHCIP